MSDLKVNEIKTDTIKNQAGTSAITIASDGKMTTSQYIQQNGVPRFSARGGATQNTTGPYVVQFTSADVNVGNCFDTSTYRFTAPVAGDYYFFYSVMSGGANYVRSRLRKNGSTYLGGETFNEAETYARTSYASIFTLAAADYVEVIVDTSGNDQGPIHPAYRQFTGFLVG